jgi:hypothetical protein
LDPLLQRKVGDWFFPEFLVSLFPWFEGIKAKLRSVDTFGRAAYGMNCLRPLKH